MYDVCNVPEKLGVGKPQGPRQSERVLNTLVEPVDRALQGSDYIL